MLGVRVRERVRVRLGLFVRAVTKVLPKKIVQEVFR